MNDLPISGSKKFVSQIEYELYPKSEALALLVYGITVQKLSHTGKAKTLRFYLHEYNKRILNWVSKTSLKPSKIDLTKLTKIELLGTSKGFSKHKSLFDKKAAATLHFHHKELELIFANETEMRLWISGIHYILLDIEFTYKKSNTVEDFAVQAWAHADSDKSGNLSFEEIKTMLKSLNIFANNEEIQRLFEEFDQNDNKFIEKGEFELMVEKLMQRPEIDEIFFQFSKGKKYLSEKKFKVFFGETQGDSNFRSLFEKISEKVNEKQGVSVKAFREYILNPELNSVIDPKQSFECMDMTQPFTSYFIASSHNTYLEGNQITGLSSTSQYIKVLLEGCRCIEIDTWDGEEGPVVTHGHTFVNKIMLKDVLQEVKNSAFVTSPYPVIFSIENHCSDRNTGLIGEIFKEILEDNIITTLDSLMSPDLLKYKYIIKGKTNKSSKTNPNDIKWLNPVFTNLVSMKSFDFGFNQETFTVYSVKENKFSKIIDSFGSQKLIQHHCRTFCRVYPSGTRINSSNYNPCDYWIYGIQMAAINYQSCDLGKLINTSLFACNGKTGYILKPSFMRDLSILFDIHGESLASPSIRVVFTVVSGFNLPKAEGISEIVNPFVELLVIGLPQDKCSQRTAVIEKNGFNPIWNEEFKFDIRLIEICFIVIRVYSKHGLSTNLIAQNSLPLFCVRTGVRGVQLLDQNLELLQNSVLVCKVAIEPIE